jgi:hypothetical protein
MPFPTIKRQEKIAAAPKNVGVVGWHGPSCMAMCAFPWAFLRPVHPNQLVNHAHVLALPDLSPSFQTNDEINSTVKAFLENTPSIARWDSVTDPLNTELPHISGTASRLLS